MTANYLQSLNWKEDPQLHKHIVTFYTKAKAFKSLALFYELCAEVEVEDFGNYSKAAAALKQALLYLDKEEQREVEDESRMNRKILYFEKMLEISNLPFSEHLERLCADLLSDTSLEKYGVKRGDVHSYLFKAANKANNLSAAYEAYKRMRGDGVDPEDYLEEADVERVLKANGKAMPKFQEEEEVDSLPLH